MLGKLRRYIPLWDLIMNKINPIKSVPTHSTFVTRCGDGWHIVMANEKFTVTGTGDDYHGLLDQLLIELEEKAGG